MKKKSVTKRLNAVFRKRLQSLQAPNQHTPSLIANHSSASNVIPRILWKPKGSLPHSQESATYSCPEPDKSGPRPHHLSWRSILILSSHLFIGLLSGLLRFSHQILYARLLTCHILRPSHSSWLGPRDFWWGLQIMQFHTAQSHPVPCFLSPLRPKYLPQYLNLEHPQEPIQSNATSFQIPSSSSHNELHQTGFSQFRKCTRSLFYRMQSWGYLQKLCLPMWLRRRGSLSTATHEN